MRRFIISAFLASLYACVLAQGELDEQDKIFYRNERTYAFLLNSNGLGCNFRYAKRIDGFRKALYEVEINYLKHPKEKRITLAETNRSIVYGKLNSVFNIKGAIGNQKELFQKRDLGGISIRRFYNIGFSLAFLKPVYFEFYDQVESKYYYDKFQEHGNFVGRAPFTMGFNEIALSPGTYAKFGYSFEYSKVDGTFHALELGIALDAYFKPVKIMDTKQENVFFVLPENYFFPTLFLSYRFGKVINSQFNSKPNTIDDILIE
jgi:hypothetical protein